MCVASTQSHYGLNRQETRLELFDVAVMPELDTGVTKHIDLDANMLPGIDILGGVIGGNGSNPGTTLACGGEWHGTHVAARSRQ